ncbi:MAG TPA: biotin synthase BioB [Deltaproteobacteria bacterium]|nr:biotin synthase BioB [Deltaproteobacteria bacterium]
MFTVTEAILDNPGKSISYDDACALSTFTGSDVMDLLMCANKIRNRYRKDEPVVCSIINAKSGLCSQDCAFCSQSAHHKTNVSIYPLLSEDKLVTTAISKFKAGARRFSMVTSGYMLTDGEIDRISSAAGNIIKRTELTVCASLGILTAPMARKLKEGGIAVYHHNLETARSYFDRVCTTHHYEEDIETITSAKSAGLRVCSGGILGLGETWEQRVELAFMLKELNVDGIPINFLNPIPGTRMEARPVMNPMEALKCIALFRLINPEKDILVCGGREITLRDYQSWIFTAGANGMMIGNYLTTQGRNAQMDIDMIKVVFPQ